MTENIKKRRFRTDSAFFWGFVAVVVIAALAISERSHSNLTSYSVSDVQPEEQILYAPWQNSKASVSGLYLSARTAARSGDENVAVASLRLALKEKPKDIFLLNRAFESAMISGDVPSAIEFSEEIRVILAEREHATDPAQLASDQPNPLVDASNEDFILRISADYSMVYLVAAVDKIKQGKIDEAEAILQESAVTGRTLSPLKRIMFELTKAWLAYGKDGVDKGLEKLDQFAGFGDIRPFLKFHGAMMLAAAGEYEKSESYFVDSLEGLSAPPRRVAELYANVLRVNHKEDKAKIVLADFWKHNRDIWLEMDELDGEIGNNGLVVADYKQGVAELFYGASSLVHQEGERNLAYQFLNIAIYLQPDLDIAKLLLAAYYERDKRYDDVIATYKKVSEKSPLWKRLQMEWAQAEAQQDMKSNKVMTRLDDVAKKYPESPLPLLHKGDILRQREEYKEATEAYSSAISKITEVRNYHWPVFYMRGICFERSKQWDKAEADFKKALELSPDNPEVLNYLAYSWLDMGSNIEEAKQMLEKAVTLRPDEGHIIDSMGWAFFRRGEYKEAEPYLERAIELMPADVTVNDHLGDLYWKMGREREARFQWQRALANKPNPEERKKIEKKLLEGI